MGDIHFHKTYPSDFLKGSALFPIQGIFFTEGFYYFSVQPWLVHGKQLALVITYNEGN